MALLNSVYKILICYHKRTPAGWITPEGAPFFQSELNARLKVAREISESRKRSREGQVECAAAGCGQFAPSSCVHGLCATCCRRGAAACRRHKVR